MSEITKDSLLKDNGVNHSVTISSDKDKSEVTLGKTMDSYVVIFENPDMITCHVIPKIKFSATKATLDIAKTLKSQKDLEPYDQYRVAKFDKPKDSKKKTADSETKPE